MSDVWRVGKNAKVTAISAGIRDRLAAGETVVIEVVGPGALNQVVKAVARLQESAGGSLAIVPAFAEVPLGHGSHEVLHLVVESVEHEWEP